MYGAGDVRGDFVIAPFAFADNTQAATKLSVIAGLSSGCAVTAIRRRADTSRSLTVLDHVSRIRPRLGRVAAVAAASTTISNSSGSSESTAVHPRHDELLGS